MLLVYLIALNVIHELSILHIVGFGLQLLLFWIFSRTHITTVMRRILFALPFLGVVLLAVPFRPGTPIYSLDILFLNIAITEEGLRVLYTVSIKSTMSVLAATILLGGVEFSETVRGTTYFGASKLLREILTFTYRFLELTRNEALRLERTWVCRYYGKRKLTQVAILGKIIGHLFIRTFDRSERIYDAMLLRGYDGTMPTLYRQRTTITAYLYPIFSITLTLTILFHNYLWTISSKFPI